MRSITFLSLAGSALAGSWSITAPNVASEATGITTMGPQTVLVAGGSSTDGSVVLKSTDGGKTFNPTHDAGATLYLDIASFGNSAVATALFEDQYSLDGGNRFNVTKGGALTSQCVRPINPSNPSGYVMVGTVGSSFNQSNGIAVSTNQGQTFTPYSIPILQTDARYGAFPSNNVWYVSAGSWPSGGNSDNQGLDTEIQLSERVSLIKDPKTGQMKRVFNPSSRLDGTLGTVDAAPGRNLQAAPNNTYSMQLIKSIDAGKTWTTLFYKLGWGYFNGIDCVSESSCCATVEADSGPQAGGYILCSFDAGATWTQTYANTTVGASLMDLRAVDSQTYWAVGGVISDFPVEAFFVLSKDAGKTWTLDSTFPLNFGSSVECFPGTSNCYATILNAAQMASVAAASSITA